ncbi:hypothetical protein RU92_GL001654 [Lactococcus cremoris subsp. tructae]|uniref:Uncharacterized protein n=1 Tax=Lactococcus cremoris subsp. tructae TaxID=542833 RepID=A0A2A5SNW7_LACLC|nr:hypothetical protein RU92_GL001654 [Lactococcus cremoris subsp. tructae]
MLTSSEVTSDKFNLNSVVIGTSNVTLLPTKIEVKGFVQSGQFFRTLLVNTLSVIFFVVASLTTNSFFFENFVNTKSYSLFVAPLNGFICFTANHPIAIKIHKTRTKAILLAIAFPKVFIISPLSII